jgi:prophage regulatory protein
MTEVFLRRGDVERVTGLGRSTLYLKVKTDQFPKPIRLGGHSVAWLESEVAAWQQIQIANRDAGKAA